jgi:hypothetical protein
LIINGNIAVTEVKFWVAGSALNRQKDKLIDTVVVRPDVVFDKQFDLTMGNTKIELMHIGAPKSHDPENFQARHTSHAVW